MYDFKRFRDGLDKIEKAYNQVGDDVGKRIVVHSAVLGWTENIRTVASNFREADMHKASYEVLGDEE